MLQQLNIFWAIPALLVGAGVTAAVLTDRVPQEVAYGIGKNTAVDDFDVLSLETDRSYRMGRSTNLGWPMDSDHCAVGSDVFEKRGRSVAQVRYQSLTLS